jgi:long-chain acyl-CoA synthetase
MTKETGEFKKIDPNQSIYQAWAGENLGTEERKKIAALEYFGNQWTFEEVDEKIDEYARSFRSLRNNPESSVTFCGPMLPSTIIAFFALNKLGIRVQVISPDALRVEPKQYLDKTNTETLFLFDGFYSKLASSLNSSEKTKNIIVNSLSDDIKDIPSRTPDKLRCYLDVDFSSKNLRKIKAIVGISQIFRRDKKDIYSLSEFNSAASNSNDEIAPVFEKDKTAMILCTSGTMGKPKGIERTNEAVITTTNQQLEYGTGNYLHAGSRGGIFIPPFFGTGFINGGLMPWFIGTTHVLQSIYNKHTFAHNLRDLDINFTTAAPSHWAMLKESDLSDGSLRNLILPFSGGERMNKFWVDRINGTLKKLGAQNPIIPAYGMSEFGPATHYEIGRADGKVGRPLPGIEARIVDDNGKELSPGHLGNLEIKSPSVMKRYFDDEERTKKFFTIDGFGKTGDLAIQDKDGAYDVITRNDPEKHYGDERNQKHYLENIETTLYESSAVSEASVVCISFENGKKIPVANIVVGASYQGKEDDVLRELQDICQKRLPETERPRGFRFIKNFQTDEVSTKRDEKILRKIYKGYYTLTDEKIYTIRFNKNNGKVTKKSIGEIYGEIYTTKK